MGVSAQRFVELHKDKVDEMKRLLITYVKTHKTSMETNDNNRPPQSQNNDREISITDDGFPILPTNIQINKLNKRDLTEMARTYLNAHYSKIYYLL
jgi:hypothetical protein